MRALSWFWQLRFLWQRELHLTESLIHLHFLVRQAVWQRHFKNPCPPVLLWRRRLLLSEFSFFSTLTPIMPWYHAQYVLQRLTHKIYLNIIFSISIAMSSLRTMLLMKLNLTSASIPFSWSVNKLETIWALNFWQIFLLYIS